MKKTSHQSNKRSAGKTDDIPKTRFFQIDLLKGLAIISVVLLHAYNNTTLVALGAPFYILQAVPVFLLLAAFTNANALMAAGKKTLGECYDTNILGRRLNRLLVPYTVIWIFQFLVVLCLIILWFFPGGIEVPLENANRFFFLGTGCLFNYLTGGNGVGNYFVPIILQQVLLVPFWFWLARRSPGRMLALAFVTDLALEYLIVISGIPQWLDFVIYARYIFVGALGVWLLFQPREVTPWILVGSLISAAYIYAVAYLGFQFWFFSTTNSFYHAFSYFWPLLIVILGFQYLPPASTGIITRVLAELGKASWHIYLVQMTYFFLVWGTIGPYVNTIVLIALACPVPCLIIGYGFYRLELFFLRGRTISA